MKFIPLLSFEQWADEMERALVFYNKNKHLDFETRLKLAVKRGVVSADGAARIRQKRKELKYLVANPEAVPILPDNDT